MIAPAKSLWGTRYQAYGGSFHTCSLECSWCDIAVSSEFFCSLNIQGVSGVWKARPLFQAVYRKQKPAFFLDLVISTPHISGLFGFWFFISQAKFTTCLFNVTLDS